MTKEAELLGKLLPALPVVEEIRRKYDLPLVSPGDDQLTEILKLDRDLDWVAIYQEIKDSIHTIPDLLPPELAGYYQIIEANKTLSPEPTFTEPATEKLKSDVTKLYKSYVVLHNILTFQLAMPWQIAIENTFSLVAESLVEYLLTGITRDVPQDAISKVEVLNVFGFEIVRAMAGPYANHEEIAKEFLDKLNEIYGDKPNITQGYLDTADSLLMKIQGIPIKDIADEYVQRHPDDFLENPETDDYKEKKRRLEDRLKTNMLRLQNAIPAIFEDKET